jgi:hypothetical protein
MRAITKAIVIVIIFALVGAVIGTAMAKRIEITIREDYRSGLQRSTRME